MKLNRKKSEQDSCNNGTKNNGCGCGTKQASEHESDETEVKMSK